MIATSASNAKNKAGNVILVLCAARFKASTGTLITAATTISVKLLPPRNMIENNVHGKAIPIRPM